MAATLPPPIRLSPMYQWQYFTHPEVEHTRLREKHGDIVPLKLHGRPHALVVSPEGVRQVFAVAPTTYEAFFKESFTAMNGEGSLWVIEGEVHKKERRLFAPAVNASHYRTYGETMQRIVRHHTGKWQPGQAIRSVETTLQISLDVIMQLVFGGREGPLLDEGRVVLHELTSSVRPAIVFFPKLQRTWFPMWRRFLRARKNAYSWFDRLLEWRRATGSGGDDVVASLLQARDEEGQPFTDQHIKNELASILGAGHETTGTALAWALYEVGRHPEIAERLRAEIETAGHDPDPGVIVKLPYLTAVVNETLRRHPTLAECARVPLETVEILGYEVPRGQALILSIIGIHQRPDIYPEPERFNPDRFLGKPFDAFEFMPYGGSHRRCLGANLADYQLRLALADIVMAWDFEPAAVDYDIRHDLAMGSKYGMPLRIKGRRAVSQPVSISNELVSSVS
jgi:cytochrome P450